jgi:hypothetical protein
MVYVCNPVRHLDASPTRGHSSFCSVRSAPTTPIIAVSLGKIRMTFVRRPISLSIGFERIG